MKNPMLKNGLSRYLKTVSILKKGYEQERYRIQTLSNSFLGTMKVREILSHHIAQYRDERLQSKKKCGNPISPATVRLEMGLLQNFYEIARIEWGMASDNPVSNVRKPKSSPGRTRRLTPREEARILRECAGHQSEEMYSIVVIAIETAMRQGEILGLRWEHINLATRVAHLPQTKNGTARDIPLSTRAKDALLKIPIKTNGRVFSYTSAGFKSSWRAMIKRLNIEDLTFHDLRHEAISRLFEKSSLDMMEVAAISGHKSLGMLKRYTHLKAQKLVKKLDGNKNKGRRFILDNINTYPAIVHGTPNGYRVIVPDLSFTALHTTRPGAIESARALALKSIVNRIKHGERPPQPDQYLDRIKGEIIMIDPLK